MKNILLVISMVALMGCANSQYQTVQVGHDRFMVVGPDPNVLRGNAFKACQDAGKGYVDYSVVESNKQSLTVICEKEPKSFFTRASEVYDEAKKRIDAWRQQTETPAPEKQDDE